jgi:hypothetical protein
MDPATRRLEIAVGAAVLEVLAQVALLVAGGALDGVALRPVFLLFKLPSCYFAWKRRPGGYLTLWIWEIGGLIAAVSGHTEMPRAVAVGIALAVMALLGRAISAFPSVEWGQR